MGCWRLARSSRARRCRVSDCKERSPTRWCIGDVKSNRGRSNAVLAALILILAAGCTTSPTQAQVPPSPRATVHTFNGGCAGTVLTDAEPPLWAQGGWSHAKGTPWPVPWAFGTEHTTVAYLFATQLVAGTSPRVDAVRTRSFGKPRTARPEATWWSKAFRWASPSLPSQFQP